MLRVPAHDPAAVGERDDVCVVLLLLLKALTPAASMPVLIRNGPGVPPLVPSTLSFAPVAEKRCPWMFEPLSSARHATMRPSERTVTEGDWSLYETFPPDECRSLRRAVCIVETHHHVIIVAARLAIGLPDHDEVAVRKLATFGCISLVLVPVATVELIVVGSCGGATGVTVTAIVFATNAMSPPLVSVAIARTIRLSVAVLPAGGVIVRLENSRRRYRPRYCPRSPRTCWCRR